MRLGFLVLLLISTAATAQSQAQPLSQPAQAPLQRPLETAPPSPLEIVADAAPEPLAGKGDSRVLSKNEAYNVLRASDGRLGVRLGNDMSFRIGGN